MLENSWKRKFWTYSPVLLCILIMLPRILSAQFGVFDDPGILAIARQGFSADGLLAQEASVGRFRPIYWLYYSLLYQSFGMRPEWFFVGNLVLFMVITALVITLSLKLGMNSRSAAIAGLSFALTGPILENVYTLCKLELLQVVWILLFFLSVGMIGTGWKWYRIIPAFFWASLMAFLACSTKETGIILGPILLVFLAIQLVSSQINKGGANQAVRERAFLLLASLAGIASYLLVSSAYLRNYNIHNNLIQVGQDQFSFKIGLLLSQGQHLVEWLLQDYIFLLPLFILGVFILVKSTPRPKLSLILEWSGAAVLWAGMYLPWRYYPEYYLLPMSIAVAILCGFLIQLIHDSRSRAGIPRSLISASLGLAALFFLLNVPNQISNGQLQLAIDRANAAMLEQVAERAAPGSRVWINIQEPNEYVSQMTTWWNVIAGRPDLQVTHFHGQEIPETGDSESELWIVDPIIRNQFYPSVRLGVHERNADAWNQNLEEYLAGRGIREEVVRSSFRVFNFSPMRFACSLIRSAVDCKYPADLYDQREFVYGWDIIYFPQQGR